MATKSQAEMTTQFEKTRVTFDAKEEYFLHNGAILLEKQISSYQGRDKGEPLKIFSAKDIQKATNNYADYLILGRAIATVYKGTLDDRTVTIKTPQGLPPTEEIIDFFLNQATTKQLINHKNVVRLYGCCIETQIPMLVYEYIANGTLFNLLHGEGNMGRKWISWPNRVRVAAEISYALSYMHCAMKKPIVHRDVKSSNIFLDEFYTAKLSNFGFSVSISPGKFYFGWPIKGTLGYIDPEYQETLKVTEKCDIYGFGVVLVELLTGSQPTEMFIRYGNLVEYFISYMAENRISDIVHRRVSEEGTSEDIQAVAELALRCVKKKGDARPTMKEVAIELRQIQQLLRPPMN